MEEKANDLCKTCGHYWTDFSTTFEHVVSHCAIVDERCLGEMNDIVPYPCLKCPFNCYYRIK